MFIENFKNFITDLDINPVTDEWYMSNFVDSNIKILSSHEAFSLLKPFISYIIDNYDVSFEYETVEALRYLKIQSDTNEIFYTTEQKDKLLSLCQDDYNKETLLSIFEVSP